MMNEPSIVFNRRLVRMRRERAAARFSEHDFLKREAAARLADRLDDIQRQFPLALDLGCHSGQLLRALEGRGGIQTLVQTDLASSMVSRAVGPRLVADEEWLPFADNSFDLVMSACALHWVNDLPGTLLQIQRILKPDGLFLAVMPGGNSLSELRQTLAEASALLLGGSRPHVSPFVDVRDAGSLLQRAGFALPVVDSETITITYTDMFKLMLDLRGMGETNALSEQARHFTPRGPMLLAANLYQDAFENHEDGRVRATVELITLTGWKPHASQPKPLRRGSGKTSLTDALA